MRAMIFAIFTFLSYTYAYADDANFKVDRFSDNQSGISWYINVQSISEGVEIFSFDVNRYSCKSTTIGNDGKLPKIFHFGEKIEIIAFCKPLEITLITSKGSDTYDFEDLSGGDILSVDKISKNSYGYSYSELHITALKNLIINSITINRGYCGNSRMFDSLSGRHLNFGQEITLTITACDPIEISVKTDVGDISLKL